MSTPQQPVLYTEVKGLHGIEFKIGDQVKVVKPKDLFELKSQISEYLEWYEHWAHQYNYYENYDVDKDLDNDEKEWVDFDTPEKDRHYDMGQNYATYLGLRREVIPGVAAVPNNSEAKNVVRKMYEDRYGKNHSINFSAESSWCYIQTKNREEAKRFLLMVYNEIIRPVLDEIANGNQ